MVMRADVIAASLDVAAPPDDPRPRLLMSPRGKPFAQAEAREWAAGPGLIILCPRFEGVDERIIEARGLIEVSIGDYVLSGGEIAALAILDACVRLIPGVMGKDASGEEESFEKGLLEYPHYTRPREWEGRAIPEVLLSGDHAENRRMAARGGGADHKGEAAGPRPGEACTDEGARLSRVGIGLVALRPPPAPRSFPVSTPSQAAALPYGSDAV